MEFHLNVKDNKILNKVFNDNGNIKSTWRFYLTDDDRQYLEERFDEKSRDIKEALIRLKYGYVKIPRCQNCGKLAKLKGHKYLSSCNDIICSRKMMVKHVKQTKLERYGDSNFVNIEKAQKTCLNKYGVINVFQSEEIKRRCKKTKLEKYNDENWTNRQKFIKTCNELYGGCGNRSEQIFDKVKKKNLELFGVEHSLSDKSVRDKGKKTCLEKYGDEIYTRTDAYREYMKHIDWESKAKKEYDTKKRNNSFNISKPEDETYDMLKLKFNDVIRGYHSDLYPFNCDFYISSLDLYIECNYHWTHGIHPYDNTTKDDLLTLNKWKLKETKFYENAIKTWTIRDVKKLKTFEDNNLNYKIFYTFDDFKKWFYNL